jgi:hypothetical protein
MTVEEFKKLKPESANLKGDDLLNAMEDYFISVQQGQEIMKPIMPLWKTHTLRWLFYRRLKNWGFSKYSETRCKYCKDGRGTSLFFITPNG